MKNIVRETTSRKDMEDFLGMSWQYLYTRRMTYQKTRLYQHGYWKGFREVCGYSQHRELNRYINGNMIGYASKDEVDGLEQHLDKKFRDAEFVEQYMQTWPDKIEKDFGEYLTFVQGLPQKPSSLKPQEIVRLLDSYYEMENKISIDCWSLFIQVENALNKVLHALLVQRGMTVVETHDLLKRLAEPRKIIPLDQERLSLLKIALANKSSRTEMLQRHTKEYGYMPMYDIDYDPYDLEYFKSKLAEIEQKSKSEVKKEIEVIQGKYEEREEYFVKTVPGGKWDRHVLGLLKFFSAYAYLKDQKPYVRDKGSYYVRSVFEEISRRLGLGISQTLFMHEKEIEDALLKEKVVSAEVLNNRIKDSAYLCRDDEIMIVTDTTNLKLIDKALGKEVVTELKGLSVSGGKVRGRVSVILSNNDFTKFQEGEILVTSATRPDFVPIIKKAKALVTDEGGMLSHAAIVARELGIPCVVGTGTGTLSLKDGDLVEVDAEKGIVKIIH
jgi:phosphohistidine swiveling domain-containing protein